MSYNGGKLIVAAVLALALIGSIVYDSENSSWAVPALMLIVGYVVGNSQVTSQTGATRPIVSERGDL